MTRQRERRDVLKALAAGSACCRAGDAADGASAAAETADLILRNGRIATLDPSQPFASAVAIKDGRSSRWATTRRS